MMKLTKNKPKFEFCRPNDVHTPYCINNNKFLASLVLPCVSNFYVVTCYTVYVICGMVQWLKPNISINVYNIL